MQILFLVVLCIVNQLAWKVKRDLVIARKNSTPWLVLDSHHLNKLNYSMPWQCNCMKVQENIVHEYLKSFIWNGILSRLSVHGRKALDILKTTCNQEVFHIARMITNSKVHCLAIQFEGHKCEAKITKSSSCTSNLVFHGWFKPIVNKEDIF